MVQNMPAGETAGESSDYYETNNGATSVKLNDFTEAMLDDMENS